MGGRDATDARRRPSKGNVGYKKNPIAQARFSGAKVRPLPSLSLTMVNFLRESVQCSSFFVGYWGTRAAV